MIYTLTVSLCKRPNKATMYIRPIAKEDLPAITHLWPRHKPAKASFVMTDSTGHYIDFGSLKHCLVTAIDNCPNNIALEAYVQIQV